MGFQIILSLLVVFAICRLVTQFYKKTINSFFFFFFLTIWSLVLFLNWNNAFLNKMGHLLGIERGATVLVYIALFLIFYYIFLSIIRFYKIERDIDRLVKKDAVDEFAKKHNITHKKEA